VSSEDVQLFWQTGQLLDASYVKKCNIFYTWQVWYKLILTKLQQVPNKIWDECLQFSSLQSVKLPSLQPKSYLDIPVSFIENHLDKLGVLEGVQKVGIKTVKVGLNADTLHHQVLRHPWHEFFFHRLFQLLNLIK